ncbi:unconventional myosin-Ib [Helicoverpa armigera]|uniref:unconventional myosin-Ib n=1 Tax=Helicoverpa armigera TaxID=29058 RepID=UPI003083101D
MADAEAAGQADAVLLAPLSEDTFLHNLHVRYKRDIIYTYVGNALVSVNPCRALPLYSAELVRAYLARPPYQLPPHLYAITATAYRWVRDRNETQCIVITGESGAGKTEAARVCLQCAAVAGEERGAAGALTAAGTLLEAFGNAATALNHNASRFGKLLEIEFDFKGEPVGGHLTHYLLEKERVSGAADGERNFHVLYQLLAGADAALLKRLRLQRGWEQYRVLRGAAPPPASPRRAPPPPPSAPPAAAALHDRDHFAFTTEAMRALGFSGGACEGVLRVLAFLLKLGNVEFEPQHNIDGSIGTRLHHRYELVEACALVGVDAEALGAALGAADEGPAPAWPAARRDQLLRVLYSRLFTWLINAVNEHLKPAEAGRRCALGILDVYGFEALAHNGLERLLINYAAERVQAAVTALTLRREQEEYAREGLAWRPLRYADHEAAADLLDAGPDSVLGALADAASDAAFLARLKRRRHPRLLVLPPDHFHVAVLGGADSALLGALFAGGASPRRPAALGTRQRALVGALVRRLPPAPRLVRCLRADAALRPHRFDAALLRRQIQDQGIMDMAQLRRLGWCESMCARAALARYGVLAPRPPHPPPHPPHSPRASPARDDPVRAARALLRQLPIPSAEFAYGRTRVFVRSPRTVWELEALRAARVAALVATAQRLAPPPRAAAAPPRRPCCWRAWAATARPLLLRLWRRLPPRHLSPACAAWPACPAPRLLGRADALLRRLHHAWRCRLYRAAFDQTARNRMREKVTASVLFKDRKANYACSVAHPFVGDYVRLRASAAWRRGLGAAGDRYVVFADVVGKVARSSGRVARCLAVLSTGALLLLEARSLRLKRRVPAHAVWRLSLSPHRDDLLVVHVRAAALDAADELSQCSERDAADAPGCLFGGEGAWRRRGDVVVRTCHVLELATKLFLVVQNAVGAPPHVNIATEFEANFGQQLVTLSFHALGGDAAGARLLRRGSRMDVLV